MPVNTAYRPSELLSFCGLSGPSVSLSPTPSLHPGFLFQVLGRELIQEWSKDVLITGVLRLVHACFGTSSSSSKISRGVNDATDILVLASRTAES